MKAVFLILIATGLLGCRLTSERQIVLSVPEGFRGPIALVHEEGETNEPMKKEAAYVIEVPASGIVFIKTDVFTVWHTSEVLFANGARLVSEPIIEVAERRPGLAFAGLGASTRGGKSSITWYYVGSRPEILAYHDSSKYQNGAESEFEKTIQRPNQPPQRNAGSRPSSVDSPVFETPSSLGPRR